MTLAKNTGNFGIILDKKYKMLPFKLFKYKNLHKKTAFKENGT